MTECQICYNISNKLVNLSSCKHSLCKSCLNRIINISETNSIEANCPFCRTALKEATVEFELEYWKNLEAEDWITYSVTLKNGTEILKTYRSSQYQPSWRNDDNVIILKRNRSRKKYRKNKRRDI